MQPTQAFLNTILPLLGADTTWLAEATPFIELHLAQNDFTPGLGMVLADLVECDFTGYAPIHAASALLQVFFDPTTNMEVIQVREPAGGWHYACTGTPTVAQQVTGFYLTDSAGTKLIAAERLPETITITTIAQAVDIESARFQLSLDALV